MIIIYFFQWSQVFAISSCYWVSKILLGLVSCDYPLVLEVTCVRHLIMLLGIKNFVRARFM